MRRLSRDRAIFALKVLVAGSLIAWLTHSGTLSFGTLSIYLARPALLLLALGVWAAGLFFVTLRWRVLLGLAGVVRPLRELVALQMTASFFNVVIPGAVGGDVVKSLSVTRGSDGTTRAAVLLLVLVERLSGLAGLIALATLVMATQGLSVWADPVLGKPAAAVGLLGVGVIAGPALFIALVRGNDARLQRLTEGKGGLARLFSQAVAATRLVSARPRVLWAALGLSMFAHVFSMTFFTLVTRAVTGQNVAFTQVATTFPLGLITVVLPIAPLGLGVGHLAFERLLGAIGIAGGANVFNVFIFGQIVPSLAGVVPYLALRSRGHLAAAGAPQP